MMNLETLEKLAKTVKSLTDECLKMPRQKSHEVQIKNDKSWVSSSDIAIEKSIGEALKAQFPNIIFMSEESNSHDVLPDGLVWVLDPLDGTTNFVKTFPFFAVSLALVENAQPIAGLVYDPNRDECFYALKDHGAWVNGEVLKLPDETIDIKKSIAMVELKSLNIGTRQSLIAHQPYKSHRSLGAAALEWCWLASNRCQFILTGKKHLWDYAAGHLILSEAGGYATDLQGKPYGAYKNVSRSTCASVNSSAHRTLLNFVKATEV